jgi:hypothetical protein
MTIPIPTSVLDPWEGLLDEERTTIRRAEENLMTERQIFERWVDIGRGFYTMQVATMRLAHTNRPIGKAYNAAYKLIEKPVPELTRVDPAIRTDAMWLFENAERVMAWRATLSQSQRDLWNNPRTLRRHFEKATRAAPLAETALRQTKNDVIAAQEERIDELEQRRSKVPGDQFNLKTDSPRSIARVLIEEMTLGRAEMLAAELARQVRSIKRTAAE